MGKGSSIRRRRADPVLVKPLLVDVGTDPRRKGDIPSRRGRQRLAIVSALFHAGFSYTAIAKQTNLTIDQIRRDIAEAEQQFQLSTRLANVMMRLDAEAVPAAVDHLVNTLHIPDKDAETQAPTAPDQIARRDTAMYRTLEGRGAFRSFGNEKTSGAPTNVALQVQFAAPPGLLVPMQQAQIVGVARASSLEGATTVDGGSGTRGDLPPRAEGARLDERAGTARVRQRTAEGQTGPRIVPEDFTD